MEFLDVFSNASQEDVAIDREAFIWYVYGTFR
jgi:hypothetical protein